MSDGTRPPLENPPTTESLTRPSSVPTSHATGHSHTPKETRLTSSDTLREATNSTSSFKPAKPSVTASGSAGERYSPRSLRHGYQRQLQHLSQTPRRSPHGHRRLLQPKHLDRCRLSLLRLSSSILYGRPLQLLPLRSQRPHELPEGHTWTLGCLQSLRYK